MSADLEFVALDIETTGFGVHDDVTVFGYALPFGCRVFCHTNGGCTRDLEATIEERFEQPITVSTHRSEADLLAAVTAFTTERLSEDDVLIVAYNGETWSGGFDLPFLRTRFALQDVDWPFRDLPYADLLPVISDLFNTTIDGDDRADLETAYDVLCAGRLDELDPFDESDEAVTAFEAGRYDAVVQHNVADITRTRALGQLAERYCSKSDFNLKSLTPTIHA